ncbi:MAG: S9 family peptidase [Rubrivivax sp.]|nr:MAG: S9 family peptidase [Rubrivivax sp.]
MKSFSIDDLYLHRKLSALHGLPGRALVVASVRSVDRGQDSYVSHLWAFDLNGGPPRQLTNGPGLDTSPRLSPQGDRVAFTSVRNEKSIQLHLINLDGGEARVCGHIEGGVSSPRWWPDGQSLLVAGTVDVDPDLRGKRGSSSPARGQGGPEVAWRLPYKSDGIGYLLAREIHLFSIDAASGAHRQLTNGPFDVMAFDPSPDGRRIAHVRTREGRFAHRTDLWVCDADGANARQLTDQLAIVLQPAWSPDGRWIAFAGAEQEGDAQSRLYLHDVQEGRLRVLGDESLEVAAVDSAVQWSADGRQLVFVRAHRGCHEVAAISIEDGALQTLLSGDRQFGAFACTADHLVYSVEHPTLPSELYAAGMAGQDEHQLSQLNPWWQERTPLQAERRQFTVPDGAGGQEVIEGWLIRAVGSAQSQPLLNDVHGGPASYALLDFDTNVFWQVLCSRGWAVLALNAVGSSSHGRAFCNRLAGRWGELDLPQHLAAIRQLQDEGVTDDRLAISGKSYGGYLSAWAIGHTRQFRAAVVMAPVGNIETHYGTSDGGYYADPLYMNTAPLFERQLANKLSPLKYVEQASTPTLFLQGKEDERCPKCQSEEMFVSLCRAGTTPTELVLYPGEGHHFLGEGQPNCRADASARIVDWLTRHALRAEPEHETPFEQAQSA